MPPKPTKAQRAQAADIALRMLVLGHTRARTYWNDQKKKASKQIDVRVFDKNLAKSLDALNDTCQNAMEIVKMTGTLDPRTYTAVKKRAQKVYDILEDYHQKVRDGGKGTTGQVKSAWVAIQTGLAATSDTVSEWLKPLADEGMSTTDLHRPALAMNWTR